MNSRPTLKGLSDTDRYIARLNFRKHLLKTGVVIVCPAVSVIDEKPRIRKMLGFAIAEQYLFLRFNLSSLFSSKPEFLYFKIRCIALLAHYPLCPNTPKAKLFFQKAIDIMSEYFYTFIYRINLKGERP